MKLTITRFQRRTIRATAKQIGSLHGDSAQMLEKRCELREKADWRLMVSCEFSPFHKSTFTRILKSAIKWLKKFFIRLLLWLHVPPTN